MDNEEKIKDLRVMLVGIQIYGGIVQYFEAQKKVSEEYAKKIENVFIDDINSLIQDNCKDLSDNRGGKDGERDGKKLYQTRPYNGKTANTTVTVLGNSNEEALLFRNNPQHAKQVAAYQKKSKKTFTPSKK